MPDFILVILAVIFVLGIAINIHEFGHFMVAKLLGIRVEAYSFFGLGKMIWYKKIGNTKYGISPIPVGAYVKLYGDEATGALEGGESTGETVPDSELYEKRPRWHKFLVMLGGPFMNIMLALAIPFSIALLYGVPSMPAPIAGVVKAGGAAEQAGVKPGDRVVSFNGQENPTWERISHDALVSPGQELPIVVDRGGQKIPLTIKPTRIEDRGNVIGDLEFNPDMGVEQVEVGELVAGGAAEQSGLQKGDRVLVYNGQTVRNRDELSTQIRENKDAPSKLTIERNGERKEILTQARLDEKDNAYRIGVKFGTGEVTTREKVGIGTAASFAVNNNLEIIRLTGKVFGQLFSGKRSVKEAGLSGPVGIVQLIAQIMREAGFAGLVGILALISLNLGVFNLLPIPLLDGGQIMVLAIEKVMSWFGRTLSDVVRERIQLAGLALILLLMVFTLFLDISKFF